MYTKYNFLYDLILQEIIICTLHTINAYSLINESKWSGLSTRFHQYRNTVKFLEVPIVSRIPFRGCFRENSSKIRYVRPSSLDPSYCRPLVPIKRDSIPHWIEDCLSLVSRTVGINLLTLHTRVLLYHRF